MAETVQIVASVAQIVDLTIKIVKRLDEYSEAFHVTSVHYNKFLTQYVIIDALDEFGDISILMDEIQALCDWCLDHMNLFLSSRNQATIQDVLEDIVCPEQRIEVFPNLVDLDIQEYIEYELASRKKLRKWDKSIEIRDLIFSKLMGKSQGMFR
ncbi:hypothetical protein BS50DRAFT_640522 [Corynespora cassiicola Philippines]|uniref:Uncharacterized protein n=1 Tax=Corynespora cassiicola Philippines TaxID=1448308 RepID=A0A2T2N4E1_CORCC|nr:hypothetical protein BS50DRAFT_640522 [Corynespora cassiicola Philippines]